MKRRNPIIRFLSHLVSHSWQVHKHFSVSALKNIEQAIKASESTHFGEIRFVVEAGLHPLEILTKKTPKNRALEVFASLNLWDTQHNTGVLIYLLLADRDVEIVADRGINQQVGEKRWELICHAMELQFRRGEFEAGVLQGIVDIGLHLQMYYPTDKLKMDVLENQSLSAKNNNEISDKPIIL